MLLEKYGSNKLFKQITSIQKTAIAIAQIVDGKEVEGSLEVNTEFLRMFSISGFEHNSLTELVDTLEVHKRDGNTDNIASISACILDGKFYEKQIIGEYLLSVDGVLKVISFNYSFIKDEGVNSVVALFDDVTHLHGKNVLEDYADTGYVGVFRISNGHGDVCVHINNIGANILGLETKMDSKYELNELRNAFKNEKEFENFYEKVIDVIKGASERHQQDVTINSKNGDLALTFDCSGARTKKSIRRYCTGVFVQRDLNYLLLNGVKGVAFEDQLTGLELNNKFITDNANKEGTLFLVSIENFKYVNDFLGQQKGNEFIIKFATTLVEFAETYDLKPYRNGGEEFILFGQHDFNIEEVMTIAHVLDEEVEMFQVTNKSPFSISMAIGIATTAIIPTNKSDLIFAGQMSAEEARTRKKNFFIADEKIVDLVNRKSTISQGLQNALDNEDFYPVFQPKFNIHTGQIIGAEALSRWNIPGLGNVYPDEFIPLLELNGQIETLDFQIIEKSLRIFKQMLMEGTVDPDKFVMSVNLSVKSFKSRESLKRLKKIVKDNGLSPAALEIEITETLIGTITDEDLELISYLRYEGFRISIDDFSAGQTSLQNLADVQFDTLKIDKGLLLNARSLYTVRDIFKMIADYAKSKDFKVLVEGVETRDHEYFLKSVNIDEVQGYYYSKPLHFEDLKKFFNVYEDRRRLRHR